MTIDIKIDEPIWEAVFVHIGASSIACLVLIFMCVENIRKIDRRLKEDAGKKECSQMLHILQFKIISMKSMNEIYTVHTVNCFNFANVVPLYSPSTKFGYLALRTSGSVLDCMGRGWCLN